MDDMLFYSGGRLGDALEHQAQKMRDAVNGEAEERLMQVDEEEWAEALAHHFAVACPELRTGEMTMDPPKDVKIDVSWDQSRYFSEYGSDLARNFPGYRTIVRIPFSGDPTVFQLRTNSFTTTWPRGRVKDGELLLTLDYAHDQDPQVDARTEAFLREVTKYLGWACSEIDSFNSGLARAARSAIAARRQRIEQRDAHLATSSIPMRAPGGGPTKTHIPDVIKRRPAPALPESRADEKAPQLEPILEEKVFEHIMEVIRMQTRQMEQSPGAYTQMGEEDRRQTIVATLNTHYAGRAAAEAFNHMGKTDILIRYEDKNLFICECKFWSGPADFEETINQLFRYVGWRDTKLAIVMFVREKGLTAILKKANATLESHPQFVGEKKAASETELRATMRWPGDEERLADLNVFFVHTPEK